MKNDDAYANAPYIEGSAEWPARVAAAAAEFRESWPLKELGLAYGEDPRERLDIFHPQRLTRGLLVFVHGGYWRAFDRSDFSHLAAGALARGWAVAMPSYPLAPQVRVGSISTSVASAVAFVADRVPGPIRLAGHSAGGQIVARLACADLLPAWRERVERVVPISPVADLAPLLETVMNRDDLKMDADEVAAESPVNHTKADVPVAVWVGAEERPAFVDQANWLADAWGCALTVEPGKNHFDVVDGLMHPDSALCSAIFEG